MIERRRISAALAVTENALQRIVDHPYRMSRIRRVLVVDVSDMEDLKHIARRALADARKELTKYEE